MRLNGRKVGDRFLDPGWTNYRKSCLYAAYDITERLDEGTNVLGVLLGNGMFFIPKERYRKYIIAFGYPMMILKLAKEYEDGSVREIVSDETWKVTKSPITFTGIYGGEDYDATLEQEGWDRPGFDDSTWQTPLIVEGPGCRLRAQAAPPLKVMETFSPLEITQPSNGVWIYDFGQNASGIPEITVQGEAHAKVKITPGELLDSRGLVNQFATGMPSYFSYTLKGGGEETWRPRFTYTGFRYLQVEGAVPRGEENIKDLPVVRKLNALHTRSSAAQVGEFSCSNELFNRIYRLIDWAIKSNMASVFTDCPHREKLGWLEQAHLMGPSVRYIYDYQLEKGATALTESWQAYPYLKEIVIKPEVVGDLRWARGEYNSIYGRIATHWQLEDDILKLNITIPTNTTATVYMPSEDVEGVTESGERASQVDGVDYLGFEDGRAIYHVVSGSYHFESKIPQ